MKKIFLLLMFVPAFSTAGDYSDFKNITSASIKPFAEDLGGLLGSGISYTARSLGFSGFDISGKTAYQIKPSDKNDIMKKERAFGFNYFQYETGMPYRIDLFIRAGGGQGVEVVGGGLKYGLWKVSDELYKINSVLVLDSHMANHKDFYAVQYGAQFVISMNMGALRPFAGIGFDDTKLVIQNVNDPALTDKEYTVMKERGTLGLRLKLNWINLSAAYNYLHGCNGVEGALGLRF